MGYSDMRRYTEVPPSELQQLGDLSHCGTLQPTSGSSYVPRPEPKISPTKRKKEIKRA